MHKKWKLWTIAAALLGITVALAACKGLPAQNKPDGENSSVGSETGTTDPTVGTVEGVGVGRPTISTEPDESYGSDQGQETTQPTTQPKPDQSTTPSETTPADTTLSMGYKQYMALSASEQQELYNKYFADDPLAFATWFQTIKQEYEDEIPEIIATGPIDLEDYIKP